MVSFGLIERIYIRQKRLCYDNVVLPIKTVIIKTAKIWLFICYVSVKLIIRPFLAACIIYSFLNQINMIHGNLVRQCGLGIEHSPFVLQ
jgi:hypothetical protein